MCQVWRLGAHVRRRSMFRWDMCFGEDLVTNRVAANGLQYLKSFATNCSMLRSVTFLQASCEVWTRMTSLVRTITV